MELGSLIGFGQLGVYFGLVYLFVHKYGSHLSKTDKWTAIWFGFDGLCHLLFEGVYVLFTFIGPIKKLNAYIVEPCTCLTALQQPLQSHNLRSLYSLAPKPNIAYSCLT